MEGAVDEAVADEKDRNEEADELTGLT